MGIKATTWEVHRYTKQPTIEKLYHTPYISRKIGDLAVYLRIIFCAIVYIYTTVRASKDVHEITSLLETNLLHAQITFSCCLQVLT